jgi:hypothetical protein
VPSEAAVEEHEKKVADKATKKLVGTKKSAEARNKK